EARLVEVFARRGIAIDSAGAFLLSRLVGLLKAKELVLLADDVPADEALRLGLCNKVVPRAELEAAARAWGERLARGPTLALGMAPLAPDLLGMHLADLGAEVIKIEQPPDGDYLRVIGGRKLAGLNLMHLRWNRGKKSVTLDLKRAEGQHLLHRLAATADVFIDGLRQGAAARCAADYEHLRAVNPRLVYCTLSGAGTSG